MWTYCIFPAWCIRPPPPPRLTQARALHVTPSLDRARPFIVDPAVLSCNNFQAPREDSTLGVLAALRHLYASDHTLAPPRHFTFPSSLDPPFLRKTQGNIHSPQFFFRALLQHGGKRRRAQLDDVFSSPSRHLRRARDLRHPHRRRYQQWRFVFPCRFEDLGIEQKAGARPPVDVPGRR